MAIRISVGIDQLDRHAVWMSDLCTLIRIRVHRIVFIHPHLFSPANDRDDAVALVTSARMKIMATTTTKAAIASNKRCTHTLITVMLYNVLVTSVAAMTFCGW